MITIEQCAEFSGLASHETVLGAIPSAKHRVLLSSYVLNLVARPKNRPQNDRRPHPYLARSWNGQRGSGLGGRVAAISFRLPGSRTGTLVV